MSVRIELDNRNSAFTCLDYMTGKVVLNLPTEETVSAITVKMEGISRTRIEPPRLQGEHPRESKRAEVEIHRLLYVVQTVFPSQEIRERATSTTGFTLKAGEYDYPFRIRIPINNSCTEGVNNGSSLLNKLSFENGKVDFAREAHNHIRRTLPPSLSGVHAEDSDAWIRYFLKVTVIRPKFYKTNMRTYDPFVFLPIEPPRPPPTKSETFARRQHEFLQRKMAPKKKGLFGSLRQPPNIDLTPVRFSVEIRLPAPAIVVPTEPLPLRILIVKQEGFSQVIMMRSLQITLMPKTVIKAHELSKDSYNVISLLSLADTKIPFGAADSPANVELDIDPATWTRASLPDTVSPSFTTCNIKRSYHLEINVGLSCGVDGYIDVLPFSLPIEVYSGIRPPKALLESSRSTASRSRASFPARKPVRSPGSLKVPMNLGEKGSLSAANSPVSEAMSPSLPPRPQSSHFVPSYANPNDDLADDLPPPTYEDAIAEQVGPVDGPRRQFQQDGGYYQDLPEDVERHSRR